MQPLPVIKGTLDVLVLKALSWSALHGFEITSWLENSSHGELEVEDSAVYQALYRLEAKGLIRASWGITSNNRRARYYAISAAGRAFLREESLRMVRYADTMKRILDVSAQAT